MSIPAHLLPMADPNRAECQFADGIQDQRCAYHRAARFDTTHGCSADPTKPGPREPMVRYDEPIGGPDGD